MKSILFTIIFSLLTVNIQSQIISDFGLKLGVGASNQSWYTENNISSDFDNIIGVSPRLFAEFSASSFFRVQTELGYVQKGFNFKLPVTTAAKPNRTGEFIKFENKLNYLSLSVSAKLQYDVGIFLPYLTTGPQLNILLSKDIGEGWGIIFDEFKENNLGFSLGAGTEIKNILPFNILLEYRFEQDLLGNYDSTDIDIKNYSHLFLVGMKF